MFKKVPDLLKIFSSAVSAVSPKELVKNSVVYNQQTEHLKIKNDLFNLRGKKVFIVGAGKAVMHMAQQMEIVLGSKIESGIISVPCGSSSLNKEKSLLQFYEGAANNLPDAAAEQTAHKIIDLARSLDERCFLLVLISGGGSALLPLPTNPVTLNDKVTLIKKLASSGADIKELNSVRKQLSDIKGGRLSAAAYPAQVVSLIISDIVGDPLDLIASGPTVYNTDSSSKARDIIHKYISVPDIPTSIKSLLKSCESQQTTSSIDYASNYILGNNQIALQSAKFQSNELGYKCLVLSTEVTGNVSEIASDYITLVQTISDVGSGYIDENKAEEQIESLKNVPIEITNIKSLISLSKSLHTEEICLIFGGEPTVKVEGHGKGGRSQQLALEFSCLLDTCCTLLDKVDVSILCAGTDGIDGPTDAAGAVGYSGLVDDAKQQQLNIEKFIENNDSYNFYSQLSGGQFHVKTGHTYTNVMDVHVMIIALK